MMQADKSSAGTPTDPVRLSDVHAKYAARQFVLRGIELSVPSGQFVVILGSSGSGKTTILRVIAGLLVPSQGNAKLFGRPAHLLRPSERSIGFVFQSLALFPSMTVVQNIEFGLRYTQLTRRDRRSRVQAFVEALRLSDVTTKKPHQLSGGQAQRAALARALAPTPRVLLLDEPFSNLDRPLVDEVSALVLRLHREHGLTTIFVTHDREQGLSLADRAVILGRDGRIIQDGQPEDLYDLPLTAECARLTGPTNFISGRIAALSNDGTARVTLPSGVLSTRLIARAKPTVGETVEVMFRPEWATIESHPPQSTLEGSLRGTVLQRVTLGPANAIHCQVGDATIVVVSPRPDPVSVGDAVDVGVPSARAVAYSTEARVYE